MQLNESLSEIQFTYYFGFSDLSKIISAYIILSLNSLNLIGYEYFRPIHWLGEKPGKSEEGFKLKSSFSI